MKNSEATIHVILWPKHAILNLTGGMGCELICGPTIGLRYLTMGHKLSEPMNTKYAKKVKKIFEAVKKMDEKTDYLILNPSGNPGPLERALDKHLQTLSRN